MSGASFLNNLFSYYDKLISPLSLGAQALISIALIIFLIWNILSLLKQGNLILLLILLAALPGTYPALRKIIEIIGLIIKGLLART